MADGTIEAYRTSGGGQAHFGASASVVFGHATYIAITALILNLAVSSVLTVVFRRFGLRDGYDETRPSDYIADPAPAPAPGPARKPAPAPARAPAAARLADPAAEGKASRVSAIPWSPGATAAEATAAADAPAVAFQVPDSLADRPRSRERLPRRK